MRPDGGLTPNDRPPRAGWRLELFYYERVETPSGERYYLRLTQLAAILIIFLSARSSQRTPTRIELKAPESTPLDLNAPVIKPVPPLPRPPTPRPTRARGSPPPTVVDPATDPC